MRVQLESFIPDGDWAEGGNISVHLLECGISSYEKGHEYQDTDTDIDREFLREPARAFSFGNSGFSGCVHAGLGSVDPSQHGPAL